MAMTDQLQSIARRSSPERKERDLVWGILLALRARGVEQLDNSGGALHTAFAQLLADDGAYVREALGFVPSPNPLMGEFRCIVEALDSAHRAGLVSFLNPTYRRVVLSVRAGAATKMLETLGEEAKVGTKLAERFFEHYKAAAG